MPTYNRLTREQRYSIETMNDSGYGPTAIARTIGVHPSTVSCKRRANSGTVAGVNPVRFWFF
jgi:IS30 family transposase